MKIFLFLCFVVSNNWIMAVDSTQSISIEKAFRTEINKQFSKAKYSLVSIAIPLKYTVNGKYYLINSSSNSYLNYVYLGRVMTNRSGNTDNVNTAEYLDYIIFYTQTFKVQKIKIIRFVSNHGVEVCSPTWLKQFVGYSDSKTLSVGKNIDAISGATATVNCLISDIQSKTYILNQLEGNK